MGTQSIWMLTKYIITIWSIILDINPVHAAHRIHKTNPDRMESTGTDFFQRVQRGYYEIAHRYPLRCVIIDGDQPEDKVFELLMKEMNNKILKGMPCS